MILRTPGDEFQYNGILYIEAEKPDVKRLQSLLSLAPKLNKRIAQWLAEADLSSPEYEDYMEFDQDYMLGLAYLLKEVILEAEVIEFTACDDFYGHTFLVYEPRYPWQTGEKERLMQESDIQDIFQKYVSVLTGKPIEIAYQAVENGG